MPRDSLIALLQDPGSYPHPVEDLAVVETHISIVALTGEFAYKVKKPVDFGFINFSTLDKRKFYCEEELRLNQRLADALYLDVVCITAEGIQATPEPGTPVLDYAVRMRQFDRTNEFDRLVSEDRLGRDTVRELARIVAQFHQGLSSLPADSGYATPAVVQRQMEENFEHILECNPGSAATRLIDVIGPWISDYFERHRDVFSSRLAGGFVRECHGDMHLANIVLANDRPTPFDCIEFDPQFRCIDIISEVAFTSMDLDHHQRADLARLFIDTWLQMTGDYAGLELLRCYKVYRALVRAKVSALRKRNTVDSQGHRVDADSTLAHLQLAEAYTKENKNKAFIITHGFSGCGKTHVTSRLLEALDAIRIRSDIERKRLFEESASDSAEVEGDPDMYTVQANDRTYRRLQSLATEVLGAGYSVIVDATHLERARREQFARMANQAGVPLIILDICAPIPLLISRISDRLDTGTDVSDATPQVLELQVQTAEPLDRQELSATVRIDTSDDWSTGEVVSEIERRLDAWYSNPSLAGSAPGTEMNAEC